MSKKYKNKQCVYCLKIISSTRDHVIAKEFFPINIRNEPIPTVPSCKHCQVEKSKLEQYLVTVLPFGSDHPAASNLLHSKTKARLQKNKKLLKEIQEGKNYIWLKKGKGPYLSTMTLPFDYKKFESLVKYIVRGLVYDLWKTYITDDYFIKILSLTSEIADYFHKHILTMSPENRKEKIFGEGVFRYICTCNSDDKSLSVWYLEFFKNLNIYGEGKYNRLYRTQIFALTGPLKEIKPVIDQLLNK
jgi:hypothetical protein